MSKELKDCPVCGNRCESYSDYSSDKVFYDCPICGRYELTSDSFSLINNNMLASYLFYKRFLGHQEESERRYHTTLGKEKCDEYKKEFEKGQQEDKQEG